MNAAKPSHVSRYKQKVAQSTVLPRYAIVFHADPSGNVGTVTKHAVNDGAIQHGQYVSQDALVQMISQAPTQMTTNKELVLTEPNVLQDNVKTLMFFTKREKKAMWTRINNKSYSFEVHYPALLYVVDKLKLELKVFALGSNQRPHSKTRLYHAPLMNISSNGSVCQGTARIPSVIEGSKQCIEKISSSITDSYFSHVNHSQTLRVEGKVTSIDLLRYWQRKSKEDARCKVSEMEYMGQLADVLNV